MKNWLYMLVLGAMAVLFPGRGTDVGELLPVELVRLRVEDGIYQAATDTGDLGTGPSLADAMEDLREGASGEIFLETADYLLLSEDTKECWDGLKEWFRPGTLVYGAEEAVEPEKTAAYLRSHTGGVPLNRLNRTVKLDRVIQSEGRVRLEE